MSEESLRWLGRGYRLCEKCVLRQNSGIFGEEDYCANVDLHTVKLNGIPLIPDTDLQAALASREGAIMEFAANVATYAIQPLGKHSEEAWAKLCDLSKYWEKQPLDAAQDYERLRGIAARVEAALVQVIGYSASSEDELIIRAAMITTLEGVLGGGSDAKEAKDAV